MTLQELVRDGWETIRSYLPEDVDDIARACRVLEVQYGPARLTNADDLLRLILLHAGMDIPLRQAVALFAESGGPACSHVTLHKKMRLASGFLRALVERLSATPATKAERWAGYDVIAVDGTSFCGPGATSTDARAHLMLRLSDLSIVHSFIDRFTTGESFRHFYWEPGMLAVGDRAYANPPGISHVVVDCGADVLVRANRSSLPLVDASGARVGLLDFARQQRPGQVRELAVSVPLQNRSGIPGRLIVHRLSDKLAEKAVARVRRELGGAATEEDLENASYVMLFTTVPTSRMSTAMCLNLYRLRWQIELAFKRWKSVCQFDKLPNYRGDTILSWLYAKLLLALIMERMAAPSKALFPPEQQPEVGVDTSPLDLYQGAVAIHRRRAAAAAAA